MFHLFVGHIDKEDSLALRQQGLSHFVAQFFARRWKYTIKVSCNRLILHDWESKSPSGGDSTKTSMWWQFCLSAPAREAEKGEKNLPTSRDCGVGMLDTTEIGASSSNKVDNRETL